MHPSNHYNFCSRCKGDLEQKDENLLVCKNCGFHFYINPLPCNGILFENKKGEVLMIIRKYDPGKGLLDVPGGFVDPNESLEESLIREIKEELGYDLKEFEYLNSYAGRYLYQGINYHTIGAIFIAKTDQDKFEALDDVGEVKFFKPEDIPREKLAFKWLDKGLNDYLEKK